MTTHQSPRAFFRLITVLFSIFAVATCLPATADEAPKYAFDVPADTVENAIKALSRQSGVDVLFPTKIVHGIRTKPVKGEYTAREALEIMLAGTGLVAEQDAKTGALALRREKDDGSAKKNEQLTGAITGRVLNSATEEYLTNARVSVRGTELVAFTDDTGTYVLGRVPAGQLTLDAFYTGLAPQSTSVTIADGATIEQNISLAAPVIGPVPVKTGDDPDVVKLEKFTVTGSREMEGAALAINEQRFAANTKTVVSTDEFGNVAEGNIGEFLKFLPGLTVDSQGGNARFVSINGVPSDNVPVTLDGFSIASAQGLGQRSVQLDMISINNLSRIEVTFSPTPETEGSALAGSVKMVTRSAFERVRPQANFSAFLALRSDHRDWENTHPGFDFSWVVPVSKKFGFTVSGGMSSNFSPQSAATLTWRGTSAATDDSNFPGTTADKPYLSGYLLQNEPKTTHRQSFGATIDWKFTRWDRLSLGFQWSAFDVDFDQYNVNFNMSKISSYSAEKTVGTGNLVATRQPRNRYNRTIMPTLLWRHDGRSWKSELGLGYSKQTDWNTDINHGYFRSINMQRNNVTFAFDGIGYQRPQAITVTDTATGEVLDPYKLSTYSITQVSTNQGYNYDTRRTAYGNLRRDFFGFIPLSFKAGFDLRQTLRDRRSGGSPRSFVGADRKSSTTLVGNDDSPVPFYDATKPLFYGFPSIELPSSSRIYDLSLTDPDYFSVTAANANTAYRNIVTQSMEAKELISALYLRFDASFFNQRLKVVGGLRVERTNVEGWGPLTDPTLNYQRDADGNIMHDGSGNPILIVPEGDALGVSQKTYLERANHAKIDYDRWFPSLNISYAFTENLIARAAVYKTVGRPLLSQYAGGLTLPNLDQPSSSTANRIVVNNAGIKPWDATTVSARLEKYFKGVGQITLSAFHREIKNAFFSNVVPATPEFLVIYGLDPAIYGDYWVATQGNLSNKIRVDGADINYKQALTFLPNWARGVQVFANGTLQHVSNDITGDFNGYTPRSASWGVSITRPKWNLRVNWNYRGRIRGNKVEGSSIGLDTYFWTPSRVYTDVLGEWYFWKRFAVYFNLRNVANVIDQQEVYGPSTPDYARFRSSTDYSSLCTFGIKGIF